MVPEIGHARGTDITDSGLDFKEGQQTSGIEIMLTQRATEVSGTVQDARARPVTDFVVVAFMPDSSKWGFMSRHVRMVRPNQDGRFSIKGLPPDDYLLIALDYLEPGEEGGSRAAGKVEGQRRGCHPRRRRAEGAYAEAHP